MGEMTELSKELCIKLCYDMWQGIVVELNNLEKSPIIHRMLSANDLHGPGKLPKVFQGSPLITHLKRYTRSMQFSSQLAAHSNCAACLYTQQIARKNYLECHKCFLTDLWGGSGTVACEYSVTSPYKIIRELTIEEFGDIAHKRMIYEAARIVHFCKELMDTPPETEEAINGRR